MTVILKINILNISFNIISNELTIVIKKVNSYTISKKLLFN